MDSAREVGRVVWNWLASWDMERTSKAASAASTALEVLGDTAVVSASAGDLAGETKRVYDHMTREGRTVVDLVDVAGSGFVMAADGVNFCIGGALLASRFSGAERTEPVPQIADYSPPTNGLYGMTNVAKLHAHLESRVDRFVFGLGCFLEDSAARYGSLQLSAAGVESLRALFGSEDGRERMRHMAHAAGFLVEWAEVHSEDNFWSPMAVDQARRAVACARLWLLAPGEAEGVLVPAELVPAAVDPAMVAEMIAAAVPAAVAEALAAHVPAPEEPEEALVPAEPVPAAVDPAVVAEMVAAVVPAAVEEALAARAAVAEATAVEEAIAGAVPYEEESTSPVVSEDDEALDP